MLQIELLKIIEICEEKFREMETSFNEVYKETLGIENIEKSSFFDFSQIINEMKEEIEKKFKGNSTELIQKRVDVDMNKTRKGLTPKVRKGIGNFFKSLFGKAEYENKLNEEAFLDEVRQMVKIALEEIYEELQEDVRGMERKLILKLLI